MKKEQNQRKLKFFENNKENLTEVVKEIEKFGEDFGVDLQVNKSVLYKLRRNYNLLPQ